MSVLVWEEDIGWCEKAKKELAKEGIAVQEADSRETLLQGVKEGTHFAVVLSLEQLIEETGGQDWEVELSDICKKSRIPVLFLSDFQKEEYELAALCAGVDDYVAKEKDVRIFVARLKKSFAVKRESGYSNTDYPDIYENFPAHQIQIGARKILLTPKEALVLHCFLHSKGEILSRETILTAAWGKQVPECRRVVDTIVKQLRYKMKETQYVIRSNYKLGYSMERQQAFTVPKAGSFRRYVEMEGHHGYL